MKRIKPLILHSLAPAERDAVLADLEAVTMSDEDARTVRKLTREPAWATAAVELADQALKDTGWKGRAKQSPRRTRSLAASVKRFHSELKRVRHIYAARDLAQRRRIRSLVSQLRDAAMDHVAAYRRREAEAILEAESR